MCFHGIADSLCISACFPSVSHLPHPAHRKQSRACYPWQTSSRRTPACRGNPSQTHKKEGAALRAKQLTVRSCRISIIPKYETPQGNALYNQVTLHSWPCCDPAAAQMPSQGPFQLMLSEMSLSSTFSLLTVNSMKGCFAELLYESKKKQQDPQKGSRAQCWSGAHHKKHELLSVCSLECPFLQLCSCF